MAVKAKQSPKPKNVYLPGVLVTLPGVGNVRIGEGISVEEARDAQAQPVRFDRETYDILNGKW
jgi:hypothetical protein